MTGELMQIGCVTAVFMIGFALGRFDSAELERENEELKGLAYEDAKRCDIDRMTADELRVHAAAMHRKLEDMRMYAQDLLDYAGDNPCGICVLADRCDEYEASKPGSCAWYDGLLERGRDLGIVED